MYEFLDEFKQIKVGEKVSIREEFFSYSGCKVAAIPVPKSFIDYVMRNRNSFTVMTIQEYDEEEVIITVNKVKDILAYNHVRPLKSNKVLNWHK